VKKKKRISLNGINRFIFPKHLVVLKGATLAVLACENLCYRSFSAHTAQFSLLNYLSRYFSPSERSFYHFTL